MHVRLRASEWCAALLSDDGGNSGGWKRFPGEAAEAAAAASEPTATEEGVCTCVHVSA